MITRVLIFLFLSFSLQAGDWPQWRFGSGHGAASQEQLSDNLKADWTLEFSPRKQTWDDPLNNDLMTYDRLFEPVVSGGRMFIAFNDRDKIIAVDVVSGKILWQYFSEGPIRLAPAVWKDKVYFTCEDGRLYCLNTKTGQKEWIFSGAPYPRKALGNERIISAWPARGGVVIDKDLLYFSASIWPFMGTFIYCLNPKDGKVVWVNSGSGFNYQSQPHGARSFAGVAPQGTLTVSGDKLIIPGGRSLPAFYDKKTGAFLKFRHSGKGEGGSFIAADKNSYFVHTRLKEVVANSLKSKKKSRLTLSEPVLDDGLVYGWKSGKLRAYKNSVIIKEVALKEANDIIKSGNKLYVATTEGISIHDAATLKKISLIPSKENIQRLLAASGRLFAVTLDGKIISFSEKGAEKVTKESFKKLPSSKQEVRALSYTKSRKGYALLSKVSLETVLSLLHTTEFHLTVLESDASKVKKWRMLFDKAGVYGKRVAINNADIDSFAPPAYIFNIVVSGETKGLKEAWNAVRPYGGVLYLTNPSDVKLSPAGMKKMKDGKSLVLIKEGALPGSADWSHMYGDIGNTVKSNDKLVKLPLGVLWFGGNTNIDVLPRHGHGPPQQIVNGRLIIEGIDLLSARDVYTGRVLWKRKLAKLGNKGVYYDGSYKESPLSTSYNQKHIPGANGRGTNYIVEGDLVYVITDDKCLVLDAETGEDKKVIQMYDKSKKKAQWAYIGVYKDYLIGGCQFATYSKDAGKKVSSSWVKNVDLSGCNELVVFNRHTGEELWRVKSNYSFIHNGIVVGNDKVFCLDRLPKSYEKKLKRHGEALPDQYNIICFDIKKGKKLWIETKNIIGSFMSYSSEHDILLQAGSSGRDRSQEETRKGMIAYKGISGKIAWQDLSRSYSGPCILHHKTIITNPSGAIPSGAYELLTGKPHLIKNPMTGNLEKWSFRRNYGCNTVIASEHLLTFRSGAAGFYDLTTHAGTGNFGGFKSSCTSNLIAANGILNAPDYTRTCSCSYQNQTSLGLIHMPELDYWITARPNIIPKSKTAVPKFGLNFGAPGDRISDDGTMWIDFPSVGGDKMTLPVTVSGGSTIRSYTSGINKTEIPWVHSSALKGLKSIEIETGAETKTVNLSFYICRQNDKKSTFSISVNGKAVLSDFSPQKDVAHVKTYSLKAKGKMTISFTAKEGETLLNGLLYKIE